jgi:hypothetical protein
VRDREDQRSAADDRPGRKHADRRCRTPSPAAHQPGRCRQHREPGRAGDHPGGDGAVERQRCEEPIDHDRHRQQPWHARGSGPYPRRERHRHEHAEAPPAAGGVGGGVEQESMGGSARLGGDGRQGHGFHPQLRIRGAPPLFDGVACRPVTRITVAGPAREPLDAGPAEWYNMWYGGFRCQRCCPRPHGGSTSSGRT